jgi:NAD(P)-dependent dehydrogenase (short-subunit alcohol dehydrogenase family)
MEDLMDDFAGKVVLITGAARGQGACEAEVLARRGATVVLTDILDAEGGALVEQLCAEGAVAHYERLDVAAEENWEATVASVRQRFGRLDGLVNNAGISIRSKTFLDTTLEEWERLLRVDLTGPFLGMRAAAPLMRDSGGGAIVNTGSIAALNGHFGTAYSSAKWGLRGLTKSAAMHLGEWGIRVNCVHPGIVMTPIVTGSEGFVSAMEWMTPMGRAGQSEEVASVVAFLLSEGASFITGIDVPVDGGFSDLAAYRKVLQRVAETGGPI